jgi:hypothetical protein
VIRSPFGRAIVPSGGDASEPTFNAATDTTRFQGNSSLSYYANNTAWGADVDPLVARFVPVPSPFSTGQLVDTSKTSLVAGMNGGKAFSINYQGSPTEFPKVSLIQAPMPEGHIGIANYNFKVGGSISAGTYLTTKNIIAWATGGGRWQVAFHDPYPPKDWYGPPDISRGHGTALFPHGSSTGSLDDNANHDYGMQKHGPYPSDLNDGNWHEITFEFWSHESSNNRDGGLRYWIDGTKVLSLTREDENVIAPGDDYPWCYPTYRDQVFGINDGVPAAESFEFGADASGSTTPFSLIFDIDTFHFFSRTRA